MVAGVGQQSDGGSIPSHSDDGRVRVRSYDRPRHPANERGGGENSKPSLCSLFVFFARSSWLPIDLAEFRAALEVLRAVRGEGVTVLPTGATEAP